MDPASVAACCWASERDGELETTDVLIRFEVGGDLGNGQLSASYSVGNIDRLGAGAHDPPAVATKKKNIDHGNSAVRRWHSRHCELAIGGSQFICT